MSAGLSPGGCVGYFLVSLLRARITSLNTHTHTHTKAAEPGEHTVNSPSLSPSLCDIHTHTHTRRQVPLLTLTSLPAAVLRGLGGLVVARSLRIAEEDTTEVHDTWWTEVRLFGPPLRVGCIYIPQGGPQRFATRKPSQHDLCVCVCVCVCVWLRLCVVGYADVRSL